MANLHRFGSRQVWRCDSCQFDNTILLEDCQMCQAKRPVKHSKQQDGKVKEQTSHTVLKPPVQLCFDSSCKSQNDIHDIKCKKCGKFLIKQLQQQEQQNQEERSVNKKEQKFQTVSCHKCSFQNALDNVTCVNCEIRLRRKRAPKKLKVPAMGRRGLNFCSVCNSYRVFIRIGQQQCNCPDQDDGVPLQKSICNYCFQNIGPGEYDSHVQSCKQKQVFYDSSGNKSYDRCTALQIETMMYMHRKCEKVHFNRQKKLQTRIEKLGYNIKDLDNLYYYVVNYAPIIIHMHANSHFQFFVNDTHYRSQFQTSKSSGSLSRTSRISWQDRMFDQKHHNAKDSQRVKYGTMNFTNDPHGVAVCTSYGRSYFLLKQHVRDRCTMTDMDSSSPHATICTFRFCYHLVYKLSDVEIKAAFQGSKAQEIKSDGVIGNYKEIQIHGPVQFKRDVEKVYIHRGEVAQNPKCIEEVQEFCKNTGLDYELFGQVAKPALGVFGAPLMDFAVGAVYPGTYGVVGGGGVFASSAPFGFGGSSFLAPSSVFLSHKAPPIKYTAVSFPYSSKGDKKKQQSEQDYI